MCGGNEKSALPCSTRRDCPFYIMSASLSLKQIFEKSQLLTTHISNPELPPLDRGLDQIEHLSQNLAPNVDGISNPIDIRA
jgi:hypothetical protein